MNFRQIGALVLAWGALVFPAPASTRYMPIEQIKPGMTGVGRTVFKGSAIEEFQVQILGVVRSNIGPQRDLILARLEGGPLAKTGVIAGMSGSPVYVDGRLIGAVSYSLGSFATEPIAGITPIGEMIDATAAGAPASAARVLPIPMGADVSALREAFARAFGTDRVFAPLGGAGRSVSDMTGGAWPDAAALRPIALPLTVGGLGSGAADRVISSFSGAGFVSSPGVAPAAAQEARAQAEPLRPGDPVGIALITGDFQFGATGTVTEIDGARVYAFGHPLYNLGPASLAMTRAHVHAVLPSLAASIRIASLGEVVGTVQQDRATAVAGVYGTRPRTMELTVSLRRDGGPARRFSFSLAEHPLLTPLLAYTAIAGIVSEHEHDLGPASYAVRGRAIVAGRSAVEFNEVYATDQPGIAAAAAVAMPIAALLTNDIEPVRVESVHLDVESSERFRRATIDRVWLGTTDLQRGRTVPVNVLLSPWRGEKIVRTLDVEIPRNAEGPLTLVVADGVRFAQWEQREQRGAIVPASVDEMIKLLNESRRGSRVYVRLVGRDTGAIVDGEAMPSLPSSVLAVMQGDRGAAANPLLQTSILGAWEIQMDQAVAGLRTLTLTLPPIGRRP